MKKRWSKRLLMAFPVAAALMVASSGAWAQPGHGPAAGDQKHDDGKAKGPEGKGPEAKDKGPEAKGPEDKDKGAAAKKDAQEILDARKDLAKARREARAAAKADVLARLRKADKPMPPAALRQEMTRHAQRLARLARMRELAEGAKDTASVERIDSLIAKENDRHDRWMDKHVGAPAGGVQ